MKASELRIGNLVDDNGLVETVTSDHLINDEHYDGLKGCLPIPLTEEWLLKFGFKKSNSDWYTTKSMQLPFEELAIKLSNGRVTAETDRVEIFICNEIKHVHQLQNLYFALTGNELEIKE